MIYEEGSINREANGEIRELVVVVGLRFAENALDFRIGYRR